MNLKGIKQYHQAMEAFKAGKKVDLNDCTFVIPVKIDHVDRLVNLSVTIQYLKAIAHLRILVIEANTVPTVSPEQLDLDGYQYLFSKTDFVGFHRSRWLNVAYGAVRTPYVFNHDVDALPLAPSLVAAANMLRSGNVDMASPFDGSIFQIGAEDKADILTGKSIPIRSDLTVLEGAIGMSIGFNKAAFRRYGWENEQFVGWGHEDRERVYRVLHLGGTVARAEGSIFHLSHPQTGGFYDPDLKEHGQEVWQHIQSMSPQKLQEHVAAWEWAK